MKAKARILYVDDDIDTCEMMCILLGEFGHEVTYATNVTDGLRLARSEQSDLIFLDGRFDDGTGVELCRTIRTFDSETPIVFCSGTSLQSEIAEAMSEGAQEFMVKPCSIQQVQQIILRLMKQARESAKLISTSNDLKAQSRELLRTSRELIEDQTKRNDERAKSARPQQN